MDMDVPSPAETVSTTQPSPGARGASAIAGVAWAVGSMFVTFGASVVAMIAIWIAGAIARHRREPLTRGLSWLVGTGAVGTVLLIAFAGLVFSRPKNPFVEAKRHMDSTAKLPPPPTPEWLRKITPSSMERSPSPLVSSILDSGPFLIWTYVMASVFVIAILAAYAGSLGWMASMLLFYAVNGTWIPKATPFSSPFDPKTR